MDSKKWTEEINTLISILKKTELTETVKWGTPVFTFNHKNIIGLAGFKNHFALWFYQGVFLKDEQNLLYCASDGKTKALRQMRFSSSSEIDEALILRYIQEAIDNEKNGKFWKTERNKALEIPDVFEKWLEQDQTLSDSFLKLSLSKKKDYIEYIQTAKREATQIMRLEKIKPMILQQIGLNDQYKKC